VAATRLKALSKRPTTEDKTHFLNVDLDVFSRASLDPIVESFGERVVVLYAGRRGRGYSAHFELADSGLSDQQPDMLISRLVRLIKRLPRPARRLWNQADAREFNIGIEAAARSSVFEVRLQPETLAAVAAIGGQVVVTVYAPQPMPAPRGRAGRRAR
jgi:hypothetical protein